MRRSQPIPAHRAPDSLPGAQHPSRAVWMDSLRGFAILLVVVEHAADVVIGDDPWHLIAIAAFDSAVSPFRMPTLMFLSGMLLTRSLSKRPGEFVLGKLGRIGWPYLFWSAAILSLLAATSSIADNRPVTVDTVLRVLYDPPTYLWYLGYLLLFYLVSLVMPSRARTVGIPIALAVSALAAADAGWQRLFFLLAFFLAGDLVSRNGRVLERALGSVPLLIVAGALAIVTATLAGLGFPVRYESGWSLGVAAGILVLVKVAMLTPRSLGGQWLSGIGRHSIVFYTTHWFAIAIVFHSLSRAGLSDSWLLFGSALAAGLGSGFVFVRLSFVFPPTRYLFELPLTTWFGRGRRQAVAVPAARH